MKLRLIRWLLRQGLVRMWLLAQGPRREKAIAAPWEMADADALAAFLETPTGKKLRAELNNFSARTDSGAILRSTHANAYASTAYARGIRNSIALIDHLTTVRTQADTLETGGVSLPDDLAFLSEH